MISKNSKLLLTLGAVYLIFWDVFALFSIGEMDGAAIFSTVFLNFLPCKALLGVTILLNQNENEMANIFGKITAVISLIFAVIHTITLVFQFVLIIKGEGATGTLEWFNIANFVGGILVLVAIFFLTKTVCNKKFQKTTLSISLMAIVIFIICHIADIVFAVKSLTQAGVSGLGAFMSECLTAGFVVWIIGILAYLLVFTIPTGVFEEKTKENE